MIINFGYVAISMRLKDASPNKTVTLKNLEKLDKSRWVDRLEGIARTNLENTIRILRYNDAYGIKLYRFTSKLVPLATHPDLAHWNWKDNLREDFKKLGDVVRETKIRVSTHPDHFTLLNSPRQEVHDSSRRDLDYHCSVFELMGLGLEYKMVLHVGGLYKNREESVKRFYEGFSGLDDRIKKRIILENDDKIYNAAEVLSICQNLKIPMVLDVHHDMCNPSKYKIKDLFPDILKTWEGQDYQPKVHLSSPKSDKDIRSHNDFINSSELMDFINQVRGRSSDFDIMLEAKMKDEALFKLMEDLKQFEGIEILGEATIKVKN